MYRNPEQVYYRLLNNLSLKQSLRIVLSPSNVCVSPPPIVILFWLTFTTCNTDSFVGNRLLHFCSLSFYYYIYRWYWSAMSTECIYCINHWHLNGIEEVNIVPSARRITVSSLSSLLRFQFFLSYGTNGTISETSVLWYFRPALSIVNANSENTVWISYRKDTGYEKYIRA